MVTKNLNPGDRVRHILGFEGEVVREFPKNELPLDMHHLYNEGEPWFQYRFQNLDGSIVRLFVAPYYELMQI